MIADEPPRWTYRLDAYRRALSHLVSAGEEERSRGLSELERMGLTQAFEITVELGWKLIRDVLAAQGLVVPGSPNPVIRAAFESRVVADARGWLRAISLRNSLSHMYKEEMFLGAIAEIVRDHIPTLSALPAELEALDLS